MTRIARAALAFVVIVGGFLTLFPLIPPDVAALDTGFQDDLVASIPAPTALAFTPDGRMLATTQPGQLRIYTGGALLGTPALDLGARGDLCANSERGLLGIAVDPNFATNRFIYLYYTVRHAGPRQPRHPLDPRRRQPCERRGRPDRQPPLPRREPQRRRSQLRQGRLALHQRR